MFSNSTSFLRCGLLNLNHAQAASAQLEQDLINRDIEVICVTEPYVTNGHVAGISTKYLKIYKEGNPRVVTLINPNYNFVPILVSRDIIAVNIDVNSVNILCINVYCSPSEDLEPSLVTLDGILNNYQDNLIVINGDFNAKIPAWGLTRSDSRGLELLNFVLRHDLDIRNYIDSPPTFESIRGKSWIDLTIAKNFRREQIVDWRVLQEITTSDHNMIIFNIVKK
ncbi:hypothetical protein AVEN_148467-1 [Araneus ventricosus]|uniref:Endonuclease/exonuclease/phosphatase domain-containing protein n=1 Tax=Araneus ventricosus TaxID=182803 RepID=A0A4Y2MLX6_ARAVE|nr:hypothetical protein AVEN_148467-1 [Araneus ventricosus]